MWAIEMFEYDDEGAEADAVEDPVLVIDHNRRVQHCDDGCLLIMTRGDCIHQLQARPEMEANARRDHVLFYCWLCERAVELHVSEIPPHLRCCLDHRLGPLAWHDAQN
jgi:hypothetical protein